MPAEGNTVKQVSEVLSQLHGAGVLNLDKSVREMMAPASALAELQQPGGSVAAAVVAWDGYGVVIASALSNPKDLVNVAGQLRTAAGGGV